MKIKGYKDIIVKLTKQDDNPYKIIEEACSITMKKNYYSKGKSITNLLSFLVSADHTSPFEHLNYTFHIIGASRSYLAQQTRHRMASYSSASQHYQNYSEYGFTVHDSLLNNKKLLKCLNDCMKTYEELIKDGIPKYEARQVLPNACENNLIISINARSLMNFFSQRLCYRNTDEIQIVAEKMYRLVLKHFPELWKLIGPVCFKTGVCNQGKMSCGTIWNQEEVIKNVKK